MNHSGCIWIKCKKRGKEKKGMENEERKREENFIHTFLFHLIINLTSFNGKQQKDAFFLLDFFFSPQLHLNPNNNLHLSSKNWGKKSKKKNISPRESFKYEINMQSNESSFSTMHPKKEFTTNVSLDEINNRENHTTKNTSFQQRNLQTRQESEKKNTYLDDITEGQGQQRSRGRKARQCGQEGEPGQRRPHCRPRRTLGGPPSRQSTPPRRSRTNRCFRPRRIRGRCGSR